MGIVDTKPLRAILEAVASMLTAGMLVWLVATTHTPQPVTAVTSPVVYRTWDIHAATAHALEQLAAFTSTTTTTTVAATPATHDFFACIRWRESRNNYQAINPTGTFRGAYQFYQGGWDTFALQVAPEWVGTPPDQAPPAVQDAVAAAAYERLGARPWNGACE